MVANLLNFDLEGLAAFCETLGEKKFRAVQLFRWIHQKGAADFDQMTDLAKSLREKMKKHAQVVALPVLTQQMSKDGTIKWLFEVGQGNAVETVFIPEENRGTLCISSQAGCAVGCRFCSTGHQGFSRNLSAAEIVAQLWFAEHFLRQHLKLDAGQRAITNVVMMGMGEPLQNYSALIPALKTMLDDHGYGLSRRRVTVSTSGVVPFIERLSQDCPVALAVSLHASNDSLRNELVPLNKKYPILPFFYVQQITKGLGISSIYCQHSSWPSWLHALPSCVFLSLFYPWLAVLVPGQFAVPLGPGQ